MKKIKKLLLILSVMLFTAAGFAQGVTTANLGGKVTDSQGEILPGANVIAIHTPSGTTYGAATDFDGFYRISNMRVGGPYKVTISYVGYKDFVDQNLYLQLGDSKKINVALSEDANLLDEVVLTAVTDGIFGAGRTGAETNVSRRQVQGLPTISRNIADFARLTPQAKISGDDVISVAGQNNRYNAIYIDGAVNNDVFGLAASGTNGGQTGVSPISLDAIESFRINVAPFDVRQSGFSGASINAITKSGTNTWEGSAYGFYRNQDFSGKTPVDLAGDDGRQKLDDFTSQIYGVRLGGPIIKDKLFFFVNYERQDEETPQPFDISTYRGDSGASDITQLTNFLSSNFGYNAGSFSSNTGSLVSDKLIAKLDWNIDENNVLSAKHSYVKALQLNAPSSNSGNINFFNGGIDFESITNSTSIELNSKIGNKFSNNFVFGYTAVRDNRDPIGQNFPRVQIEDGAGNINFGSEPFSTANLLEQDIVTLTNNFNIYSGRHTITIGGNLELSSSRNVFFRQNFGDYRFSSLSDFLNGERPNRYRHGYSLIGEFGDESQGAAEFDFAQLGFYVQDEVNVTDNFRVTFGLRFDIPYWEDGLVNENFNNYSIPLFRAAGKDLQGASTGPGIDPNVNFSPRLGFNWDVKGDSKTQIRGGLGIFTSRMPLVWPGGVYNNNGLTNGFVQLTGSNTPFFNPDPFDQFQNPAAGSGAVGGEINLFAKDFSLPQVFKTNIAIDQKLPGNLTFSADFVWNDNINAITYENINLEGPQFETTGAGSRPNYGFRRIDNTYDAVYLASNTSLGSSFNVSGTLSHALISDKWDIRTAATYSYGESTVLLDATSSQNSSQWRNLETVNGSNRPDLSVSDFDPGHRIITNSTIEFKWSDKIKTRLGLFYEAAEGAPFSYVVGGSGLLSDTGSNSALAYIPANQSEIVLVDRGGLTASQQWVALNEVIVNNDYLRSRRGQFAERNADRSNWSHIVDLKFAQEFGINFGGNKIHRFEFTFDIFNFTNLINKEWGVRNFAGFNQVTLLDFRGFQADGTTPTFAFSPGAEENANLIDDSGLNSSRWQAQVGLRYSF